MWILAVTPTRYPGNPENPVWTIYTGESGANLGHGGRVKAKDRHTLIALVLTDPMAPQALR